jgi:ABC-type nitrate/sulfonate/bicarbonate transport system substrate-binding protein
MKSTNFRLAFLLCVPLLFTSAGWAQEIKKLQKLRVAIPSRSMSSFPHIVALRQGFYQQEGFDVELIVVSSGIPGVQAVVAGDLDFTTTGNVATLAALRGMPIRNVMVSSTATDQTLLVRPEIRRVGDLKGKVLGVAGIRSISDVSIRLLLTKYGLVPDVDVTIVTLGGSGVRLTALQGGKVDGTLLSAPQNKAAVKMGFRELIFMKDLRGVPSGSLSTSVRKIQNDPDSIVRVIRVTLRALRFIKGNKEETLKLMSKELGIKDREISNMVYDDSIKLYSDTGIPSDASVIEEIAIAKEILGISRDVSTSEVSDWSFVRTALKGLK